MADAASRGDVVMVLVPDELHHDVWEQEVRDGIAPGNLVLFGHGFSVHYGEVEPPADVDVALVAPKGPGHLVRRQYTEGSGVPGLIAIEQDASGNAKALALAYARGIGCTRGGVIETTFKDETETDLFGEQAVLCGGATALVQAGFETLVEAGYDPQMAYFECLHELKLIVDLMYEKGMAGMRYSISNTAEYGDYTRGPRVVDDHARAKMKRILGEIQSGQFAREWIAENRAGQENFKRLRAEQADTEVEHDGEGAALPHGLDQAELLAGGRRLAAMRRAPAALLGPPLCAGVALALLGCGGGGAPRHPAGTATAAAPPPPLRARAACPGAPGFTCATLRVPLDRARPAGTRLALRVAVQRAPARRGVLVVLAGGPGQPGVPFAAGLGSRLGAAARGWRLVLVDQRGTGAGALRCPALQRAVGTSDLTVPPAGAVTACARRLGARRTHFTTADTVADLDDLRRALGRRGCPCWARPTGRSSPSATRWPTRPGPGASSWTPSCRTRASSRRAPRRCAPPAACCGRLPGAALPRRSGRRPRRRRPARRRRRRAPTTPSPRCRCRRPRSPGCPRRSTRRGPATRRPCGRSSRR